MPTVADFQKCSSARLAKAVLMFQMNPRELVKLMFLTRFISRRNARSAGLQS